MKSEIWDNNTTAKALTMGYSLEQISIFDNECEQFLKEVLRQSAFLNNTFKSDSKDLPKANWMILNEITSSLYDCHQNIISGNIRIASRIFRDTLENLHILELLNKYNTPKYLDKWYANEVISHSDYRDWLKINKTSDLSILTRDVYRLYSKYAHRTFKSILESYSESNNTISFKPTLDRENVLDLKILSRYYSHLSYFVINSTLNYSDYKVLKDVQIGIIAEMFVKS